MSDPTLREAYIQKLEEENELLRERIILLEEVIGYRISVPLIFGLSMQQSAMLGVIVKREVATKEMLLNAIMNGRPEADEPELKIVDVQICKMRPRLNKFGIVIETVWGRGYRMDPENKARFATYLEQQVVSAPEVAA